MSDWLTSGTTDPAAAESLRAAARAIEPGLNQPVGWTDLVQASLSVRLRDFIDLRQDARILRRHIEDGTPVRDTLAFPYTAIARTIRHRDHGMAALSAVAAVLAILATSALWIATGWPDGSAAPMMAAVACCFFAAQDDPAPMIFSFANSAVVGAIGAGLYLFVILPMATTFEMVVLALAPGLIFCGVLMTRPRTALMAMGVAVNGATMIALQNGYTGDFAPFVNSAVALVTGMWSAAIVTVLVRSVGAAWSARRLRRINRRSLARAADRHGAQNGLELAALMLDRVGLIAPRLTALPPEDAEWVADLLVEVRVGINVVELRRVRAGLSVEAVEHIDRVLAALAHHFRSDAGAIPKNLLGTIDAALEATAAEERHADSRGALLGLAGLRRALFPDAPPFRSLAQTQPSEMAA